MAACANNVAVDFIFCPALPAMMMPVCFSIVLEYSTSIGIFGLITLLPASYASR